MEMCTQAPGGKTPFVEMANLCLQMKISIKENLGMAPSMVRAESLYQMLELTQASSKTARYKVKVHLIMSMEPST